MEPQKAVDFTQRPFRLVEETLGEVYPGVNPVPYIMTGGTDAYFYSPLTENALRFAPLYIDKQQLESIHGLNENMFVDSLPKGVEFYKRVIKKA
jgi:carboxypeptidase PM20D1